MKLVLFCGLLMMGGGVGFAVARGHDFGGAAAVAAAGLVLGLVSLAGDDFSNPAAQAGVIHAAGSPAGLMDKIAAIIGFGTTAGALGLGFVVGVLLVHWGRIAPAES